MNLDELYKARYVLNSIIRRTDLVQAPRLNPEADIYLKPENLQVTGSFKVRGACYKISQLSKEEKERGVIACSAGNHAQGVALGASHAGVKSLICLPEGAPISKVEATRRFGADICLVPGVYDDAFQHALKLRDEHGYAFVHPFNDEHVIAGQGTIGLELLEQLPDVQSVIVPIGGGGLASGIAFAIKSLNPAVEVWGVQAAGAPGMYQSMADGHIQCLPNVCTVADGIAVKQPGDLTYEMCRKYLDGIVTVTEDEICAAILAIIEQQKMVVEGAGAVAVAAAMFNKVPIQGKKTICLLSGGNVDVTILNRVIHRGLVKSGRICKLTVKLEDKPGQLVGVSQIISSLGGNVVKVNHERNDDSDRITDCILQLRVETRNHEHIDTICNALADAGFDVTCQIH
ncbi:MAG: threonine ammonia-lyase [Bacteroidaceae bacterium]|jgi:threonine dehydratase|nr:threonine ammonia-lyase [Bacteroidaceae bacterium]MBQ2363321.1 threonine ammonia-lyase [Bacteroidaceae bacterium]MBQ5693871.1 threonine ammonia-lyase [Bacteroidaceae bacterium]MBQ5911913.1 threonine ammonia-lyase [Bacteroidaceae bacterium]